MCAIIFCPAKIDCRFPTYMQLELMKPKSISFRMKMTEIVVDYWENQRYKPLQGWSVPYKGGVAPYSDISGRFTFQIERIENNTVYLPPGWEWAPDSTWSIDHSGIYGQTDADGWSYAVSFDGLIESSKMKNLKSERSTSNVVRRRRWCRTRICVSTEVNGIISLKAIWANIVKEKITEVVEKNESNFMRLTEYNSKQKKVIESILLAADLNLSEVNSTLDTLNEKLLAMKSFLIERGLIESQYSKKLETLASKWMTAGMPKKPTSRLSFTGDASTEAQSQNVANSGFFYVVSAANQSIAERLNEYSILLSDGLPKDVTKIIDEVAEALHDCKREGQDLRNQITAKSKIAAQSYEVYSKCQEHSQSRMLAERDAVITDMYQCSATITDNAGGRGDGILMDNTTAVGGGNEKESCFNYLQNVDVWLAMQLYNTDLIDLDSTMLQYNAFCKQQQKKANNIGVSVGELLKSTVKVFAYEQFRVWQDSAGMLDAVAGGDGGGSGGISGNNTPNSYADSNPMHNNNTNGNNYSDNTAGAFVGSNTGGNMNTNPMRKTPLKAKSTDNDNNISSGGAQNSTVANATNVCANVNPLRRNSSKSVATPTENSTTNMNSNINNNSSNDNSSNGMFVNPMSRGKSGKMSPHSRQSPPIQQYPSSDFMETDNDDDAVTSGFENECIDEGDLDDIDEDGNKDSNLKLPSHNHLRLSNSRTMLVKVGVMKVLIQRSGGGSSSNSSTDLTAGGISGLSTINNKTSAISTIDYSQFMTAVVILTFNRVLHIMHYTDEVATAVGTTVNEVITTYNTTKHNAPTSPTAMDLSSVIDETTEQLLSNDNICFDKHKIILSINLAAGCHVGPVFIPKDGYRDSFEVQIPPQRNSLMSGLMGSGAATVHKTDVKGITSVLFTTDDSIKVRNWMRSMSNPFVDPNIDSPQDFECEENEYIAMGNSAVTTEM